MKEQKMKIGDLVRMPSSKDPWIAGVIVDTTTRVVDHRVGVKWPNHDEVIFEPVMWIELLDSHYDDDEYYKD